MRARSCVALVAVCVLGAGFAPPAFGATGVLLPKDVAGLHRIRASSGAERRDLSAPLSPSLRQAVARARIATSAFGRGGLVIRSASFYLGHRASQVTRAWHRGSRPIAVGNGGFVQFSKHSGRLVFRVGGTVVLLETVGPKGRSGAALLLSLAQNIASRLQMPPQTAFAIALGGRPTDMSLPRSVALRAFAAVYGLPGIKAPRGAAITDGSGAVGLLLRFASTLTPAQRAAAERELGVGLSGSSLSAGQALARAASTPNPDPFWTGVARLYLDDYIQRINAANGNAQIGAAIPITVSMSDNLKADVAVAAYPLDANGNESSSPTHCLVRASRQLFKRYSDVQGRQVIAEVTFRCLIYQLNPAHWQDLPLFTFDGFSAYAAETLVAGVARLRDAYSYFIAPGTPAEARAEDAAFIFGRAEEVYFGAPLWGQFGSLITAYQFGTIFSKLNLVSNSFLDSWGSSLLREKDAGLAWTTHLPEYYPYEEAAVPISHIFDKSKISAPPSGNAMYQYLEIPGQTDPIVMVRLDSGHARVGDNDGSIAPIDTAGEVVWICGGGVDCRKCPDGGTAQLPTGIQFASGPTVNIAVTGDIGPNASGASGIVESYSINDFCADRSTVPDPDRHGLFWATVPPYFLPYPSLALPEMTRPRRVAAARNFLGELAYLRQADAALSVLIDQYLAAKELERGDPSQTHVDELDQRRANVGALYTDISLHGAATVALVARRINGYRAVTPAQLKAAEDIVASATRATSSILRGGG